MPFVEMSASNTWESPYGSPQSLPWIWRRQRYSPFLTFWSTIHLGRGFCKLRVDGLAGFVHWTTKVARPSEYLHLAEVTLVEGKHANGVGHLRRQRWHALWAVAGCTAKDSSQHVSRACQRQGKLFDGTTPPKRMVAGGEGQADGAPHELLPCPRGFGFEWHETWTNRIDILRISLFFSLGCVLNLGFFK